MTGNETMGRNVIFIPKSAVCAFVSLIRRSLFAAEEALNAPSAESIGGGGGGKDPLKILYAFAPPRKKGCRLKALVW
ncbi:hypothetical protein CEXT_141551 [Caerostris extrusa]|uniref:Uncharacterized protein n=1 Tax=Caerostris extrusa TaxID=172846 RepID=A0AAV4XYR9_CAEEX|nr:hypothetical protein CEXT_141551 [Caerostris extrusa]